MNTQVQYNTGQSVNTLQVQHKPDSELILFRYNTPENQLTPFKYVTTPSNQVQYTPDNVRSFK